MVTGWVTWLSSPRTDMKFHVLFTVDGGDGTIRNKITNKMVGQFITKFGVVESMMEMNTFTASLDISFK